jgi:hypothetical protein
MNARERFLATMAFEPVDRPPLWEFGYWTEVLVRWYEEGLPHREGLPPNAGRVFGEGLSWDASLLPFTARDRDVHLELGFDDGIGRVPLNSFVYPPFERRVLEETGNVILVQDERGHHLARHAAGVPPQSVRSPVETSEDWERFRRATATDVEGRLPAIGRSSGRSCGTGTSRWRSGAPAGSWGSSTRRDTCWGRNGSSSPSMTSPSC